MMDQYFVTCRDAGKTALLLGPFTNEKTCKIFAEFREDNPESRLSEIIKACEDIDPRSHFYEYGMIRIKDVKPEEKYRGILNKVNPEKWDGELA